MLSFYSTGHEGLIKTDKWEASCWVNVEKPDENEKKFVLEELKIPEGFYNDVEDSDERPRLEYEDGWFFVLLRIPYKNLDNASLPYYTVPIGVIFREDVFVTICFYKTEMIDDFIKYTSVKKIKIANNFELLMRLFISSSVWYSKYLKQINKTVSKVENILDKNVNNKLIQSLFSVEKSLIYFMTTLTDHTFLLKRLRAVGSLRQNVDAELIEDVEIELMQAQTTTKIYSDILRRMEDAYDSVMSNNLNNVMKHLTSISIILMIPTLVASFYGMNVPNAWEHNPAAFLLLVLASFFLSVLSFLFFKKLDWF